MNHYEFTRTELLLGSTNIEILKNKKVAILGIGGVGSFASEGLVRSGIENLILVDNDTIDITNLNRQIHSIQNTIGLNKIDVMKDRITSINPNCNVTTYDLFIDEHNIATFLDSSVDYVIDAIDTVKSKLDVIQYCHHNNIKIITCLGTGNRLDPTKFVITDIKKTSICPLARSIRLGVKKIGIKKLKVLFSTEYPKVIDYDTVLKGQYKKPPGSISFVPSVAGMILTSAVVNDLIEEI